MSMQSKLTELIKPVVEGFGCQLWGIEYLPAGNHATLRVYIESAEKVADLSACEQISRQLGALMDVEDPIETEYNLEVSTPGVDRRIFFPEQFLALVGQTFKVRLTHLVSGRRRFVGQLKSMHSEDAIEFLMDDEPNSTIQVAFSDIDSARLKVNWEEFMNSAKG
jgi:ribosome maturation factor RimP